MKALNQQTQKALVTALTEQIKAITSEALQLKRYRVALEATEKGLAGKGSAAGRRLLRKDIERNQARYDSLILIAAHLGKELKKSKAVRLSK